VRIIVYIILTIFIMGCHKRDIKMYKESHKIEKESAKYSYQEDTKMCTKTERYWTNVYGIKNLNSTLKRYNYRYKIASIDTRNWTKNKSKILKTRKIIKNFSKKLGKKAILGNLIDKTSKKRAYVKKVQKELNTSYNLNTQAPFFILYKKSSRRGKYRPYKIVSISSISLQSLKRDLTLLTKAINSGKSKKEIYASLSQMKQEKYALNRSMVREVLIEALESTLEGCE